MNVYSRSRADCYRQRTILIRPASPFAQTRAKPAMKDGSTHWRLASSLTGDDKRRRRRLPQLHHGVAVQVSVIHYTPSSDVADLMPEAAK